MTGALSADDLRADPNPLAGDYRAFAVTERLLLTGHSHQAWPDVARDGLVEAFDDAAAGVDEKWERAFAKADAVRTGFGRLLGAPADELALGINTHELVIRWLSALDLRARPRLVTTDGEFHTIRRQLGRLRDAGIDVMRIATHPVQTLAERLAAAADDRTAAVLVSAVLFETAAVVGHLGDLAAACRDRGVELLVDVYHALGPVPFSIAEWGLADAWVVGGGYKYLQLGEGNCFLRLPPHAQSMRPVITGWFAEFDALAQRPGEEVAYGTGASRFAGSTYDPSSHYRAARVFEFFEHRGLTAELLQASYAHQVARLADAFDALDLPDGVVGRDRQAPLDAVGGFLALRAPRAADLQCELAARGVLTDSRGSSLRLGPAPYLSDAQLDAAVAALGDVAAALT